MTTLIATLVGVYVAGFGFWLGLYFGDPKAPKSTPRERALVIVLFLVWPISMPIFAALGGKPSKEE